MLPVLTSIPFLAKSDLTNYLRSNEDITRMQGQFLDKSEVKSDVNIKQQQQVQDYINNRIQQGILKPCDT